MFPSVMTFSSQCVNVFCLVYHISSNYNMFIWNWLNLFLCRNRLISVGLSNPLFLSYPLFWVIFVLKRHINFVLKKKYSLFFCSDANIIFLNCVCFQLSVILHWALKPLVSDEFPGTGLYSAEDTYRSSAGSWQLNSHNFYFF